MLGKSSQDSSSYPTGAKQKWKRAGLFKGLKSSVQMLNFVVFHLFPVLNVLANDIWVTSGELRKSWDSVLAVLPRSRLLPWTLMSDSRNEMLPLRPETRTTDQINTQLSLLFHCCFIGDYVAWVVTDLHWYDVIYHHVTTVQSCRVYFGNEMKNTTPLQSTTARAFRDLEISQIMASSNEI